MLRGSVRLLLLALVTAVCAANRILLFDTAQNHFVRAGPSVAFDHSDIGAALAGLLGLVPPHAGAIGEDVNVKVNGLLRNLVLKHPKAYIVINVAAATPGVAQLLSSSEPFSGRAQRVIEVGGTSQQQGGHVAVAVMQTLNSIMAANPDMADVFGLDEASLKDCDAACLEQQLASAAELYDGALERDAERQLAGELAGMLGAARNRSAVLAARRDAHGQQQDIEVYESTLLGLQQLQSQPGPNAVVPRAVEAALVRIIGEVVRSLDQHYDGETMIQVNLLDSLPVPSQQLSWVVKPTAQRRLLQNDTDEDLANAKLFSTHTAAFGIFVLVLYFTFAGIYCMCTMQFKQDSLLYSRSKTD